MIIEILRIYNKIRILFLETFYNFYFIMKRAERKGKCLRCGKCCSCNGNICPFLQPNNLCDKGAYAEDVCRHFVYPRDEFDQKVRRVEGCGYYWEKQRK